LSNGKVKIEREVEKYINPKNEFWEFRYYYSLLNINYKNKNKNNIINNVCINYLEGLEWCFIYYSKGCPDWQWRYNYNYPPLLKDLVNYVPLKKCQLIKPNYTIKAVHPSVQLAYVLPKHSLHFIGNNMEKKLLQHKPEWYGTDYEFMWAYCKYFWESHVELPDINIVELETAVLNKIDTKNI